VVGDPPAEGCEEARRVSPLGYELIGHLRPIAVVAAEQLDSIGRRVGPEAEDHCPGVMLLDLAEDEVRGAEQRVHRAAVGARDRLRKREERPVEHRGRVDDQ
jgi:hypothetical protein